MKNNIFLSASCAVVFAVITYFIVSLFDSNALILSIISGLGFFLLLYIFLEIYIRKQNKRYKEIEEKIKFPVWYRSNCNIQAPKGIRNGNVYFTDEGVLFVSLDKKPYIQEEILKANIKKLETDNVTCLLIYTNDDQLLIIRTGDLKTAIPVLQEHGWL